MRHNVVYFAMAIAATFMCGFVIALGHTLEALPEAIAALGYSVMAGGGNETPIAKPQHRRRKRRARRPNRSAS
jgi:hypothetical protein